jgi:predicted O-methyltransferase YrrM
MTKERYYGFYSTNIYLPCSALSKRWRNFWRRRLGKEDRFMQDTHLPSLPWRRCTVPQPVRLCEHRQENGNVRISELGILAQMAANCVAGKNIFEIGTFDGRTTLNLALNAPRSCRIMTLDLPPALKTQYELASGEGHFVEKPEPGVRYKKHAADHPDAAARISQFLGDSAIFDFSAYEGTCSLVFVDGSHAYDYVLSDTDRALKLVDRDGVVIWHDYGVWEGVTRALEEIEKDKRLGLVNIKGTSLVYWKNRDGCHCPGSD